MDEADAVRDRIRKAVADEVESIGCATNEEAAYLLIEFMYEAADLAMGHTIPEDVIGACDDIKVAVMDGQRRRH